MNRMNHTPYDVDTWLGCYCKEKWISAKSLIAGAIDNAAPNLLQQLGSLKKLSKSEQFTHTGSDATCVYDETMVRGSLQGGPFK